MYNRHVGHICGPQSAPFSSRRWTAEATQKTRNKTISKPAHLLCAFHAALILSRFLNSDYGKPKFFLFISFQIQYSRFFIHARMHHWMSSIYFSSGFFSFACLGLYKKKNQFIGWYRNCLEKLNGVAVLSMKIYR